MPSRSGDAPKARERVSVHVPVRAAPGGIGKLVCTKNFHCVMARDAKVFYKVLVQLK